MITYQLSIDGGRSDATLAHVVRTILRASWCRTIDLDIFENGADVYTYAIRFRCMVPYWFTSR